jgi:hypothetical protein
MKHWIEDAGAMLLLVALWAALFALATILTA